MKLLPFLPFLFLLKSVKCETIEEHCNKDDFECGTQQEIVKQKLRKILFKEPNFKKLFGKVSNVNVLEGFFKDAVKKYKTLLKSEEISEETSETFTEIIKSQQCNCDREITVTKSGSGQEFPKSKSMCSTKSIQRGPNLFFDGFSSYWTNFKAYFF